MTRIEILLGVVLTTLCSLTASAENPCTRVGQEICQDGQTYRCEKAFDQIAPMFQNRPCTVSAQTLEGTWRGSGHQTPADSGRSDYQIVMTISSSGGKIDYPTLGCGGTVTRTSGEGTSAQYREHISYGQCIDGGSISVNLFRGNLAWTWSGQAVGKHYTVIAALNRN